jgi:hypothetical protein
MACFTHNIPPMRQLAFTAVLLGALLSPSPLFARWEGTDNNKSVSELEAMSTDELFQEGFDVCTRRALLEGPVNESGEPTNPPPPGVSEYLDTIQQAASEKNGGTVPPWMDQLIHAHTSKQCQRAFRTYLEAKAPKEAPPLKRKRHPIGTQLPPWLAPR